MTDNPQHRYWLGLHLLPRFGINRLSKLLAHFESPEALWRESDRSVMRLPLPDKLLAMFCAGRRDIDLDREMDKVAAAGADLVTQDDEAYPALLRQLDNRPVLLYVRGQLAAEDEKRFGVVGTRKASKHGWDAAYELSRDLAQAGVTVVSGLAQGIDSAAHRGALKAGGRTIAVMGTGIDTVYPRENADLAEDIVACGAVITEFPIGMVGLSQNFPQRNRVISGISLGVLVAEADEKSGALNTAGHALDQGRDVFAVPHSYFNVNGRGCNRLIQDGARLVMDSSDILDALDVSHIAVQAKTVAEIIQPANETERAVLAQLEADPTHVDDIVRGSQLPTATVTSTLALLELKGLVDSAGAMQYCLARNASQQGFGG